MAITSIKTGSSFTNLIKYNDFLAGNPGYDPAATFLIQRVTGTGGFSLTFTSIPQGYKHLQIRGLFRDGRTVNTVDVPISISFNSDTGSNYISHTLRGNGSTVTSDSSGTISSIYVYDAGVTAGTTAGIFGGSIIDIHDYSSTSKYKTVRGFAGGDAATASTNFKTSLSSGLWLSTNAINSITLTSIGNGIATGSTFALYGMVG
jgi:hypothetical protein